MKYNSSNKKNLELQGVFKKIPNLCYKDFILQHFKHCPLQSSPLLLATHLSHRFFRCWNVSWIALFVMARGSLIAFSWISACSKKRTDYLNSPPTSIEGALRLLSAPSDRFWQQTAFCPVSLWVLVLNKLFVGFIRRTACARTQFNGCSSTTIAHSETRQMAVCYQNLPLGALSSLGAPSMLVGGLFKKLFFFNASVYFV